MTHHKNKPWILPQPAWEFVLEAKCVGKVSIQSVSSFPLNTLSCQHKNDWCIQHCPCHIDWPCLEEPDGPGFRHACCNSNTFVSWASFTTPEHAQHQKHLWIMYVGIWDSSKIMGNTGIPKERHGQCQYSTEGFYGIEEVTRSWTNPQPNQCTCICKKTKVQKEIMLISKSIIKNLSTHHYSHLCWVVEVECLWWCA